MIPVSRSSWAASSRVGVPPPTKIVSTSCGLAQRHRHLALEGRQIAVGQMVDAGQRGEVAIAALVGAERDVDVGRARPLPAAARRSRRLSGPGSRDGLDEADLGHRGLQGRLDPHASASSIDDEHPWQAPSAGPARSGPRRSRRARCRRRRLAGPAGPARPGPARSVARIACATSAGGCRSVAMCMCGWTNRREDPRSARRADPDPAATRKKPGLRRATGARSAIAVETDPEHAGRIADRSRRQSTP